MNRRRRWFLDTGKQKALHGLLLALCATASPRQQLRSCGVVALIRHKCGAPRPTRTDPFVVSEAVDRN